MSQKANKQEYRIYLMVLNILEMYPDKYSKIYSGLSMYTSPLIEGKYFHRCPIPLPVLIKFKF